ncbi:MAG TPA: EAL domain-containing protein [Xanthobacteraceae bacterium]|nr:EAL domain-containing protein [Xanthobacteraceae bacterium]
MIRSRQKKLIAAVVGVLLAGLPLAAFDIWLEQLVERQSSEDIFGSARRTIAVIDTRLTQVAAALDGLAAHGVTACVPADLERLRQAALVTTPAKEIGVIAPNGQMLCSDLGIPLSARVVAGPVKLAPPGEILIEITRVGDRPVNYLRMRRFVASGTSLAALVPTDLLIPLTAPRGGPFAAHVRILTQEGAVIEDGGVPLPPDLKPDEVVRASLRSERFGITADVAMLRSAGEPHDLKTIGLIVNLVVVAAVLTVAWLMVRRRGGDPVAEIRRALDAREFLPYFQPIIDITSGKVLGAEVLARWRKADGSVVLPGAFIVLAERGGLMIELTEGLMRRACREIGDAYARRPQLRLAFNLTARHFADDAIVADLRAIFDRSPIRLSQVTLELTEREPIEDIAATRRVVAALQGLGCQVALDDVGTGHSGLSSILKLGVDVIKIDKMFIDSLGSETNSATIVTTLVELARNMHMEIVAEGVESFEQVADLRQRGIRAAQGYVFAPPLPAAAFKTLLDSLDPVAAQPEERRGLMGWAS